MLGFAVEMRPAPGFAMLPTVTVLALESAGRRWGRPGYARWQCPGAWYRFQFEVEDLEATIARMNEAGCRIRNEIVAGQGGKQIVAEDPSGNCVELFEPDG